MNTPVAAAAAPLVAFFEQLTPAQLAGLGRIYTEDATFKDPFNEVSGLVAIRAIFEHMYASLQEPHFVVTGCVGQAPELVLIWEFRFRFRAARAQPMQVVRGCSHLLLADDGRIRHHRDYWDAAEELYEKLPLLGTLMRWLRRRVNAG
jgi:hypothetical protein